MTEDITDIRLVLSCYGMTQEECSALETELVGQPSILVKQLRPRDPTLAAALLISCASAVTKIVAEAIVRRLKANPATSIDIKNGRHTLKLESSEHVDTTALLGTVKDFLDQNASE